MSAAIILPARLASTRLPNKLLLDRTGKTVLEHTIDRAKEARAKYPHLFTTVRVACDDEKLIAAAKRAGVEAVMTRKDHQSGTDRIAEACAGLKEDIIVNLQSDEPEISADRIAMLANALKKCQGNVAMATLATYITNEQIWRNPNVVKVVFSTMTNCALYFSRAPFPPARDEDGFKLTRTEKDGSRTRVYGYHHIGMYAYRRDFLAEFVRTSPSTLERLEKLEQLRALEAGYGIYVELVDSHVPGIDTPEDYEAFVKRWTASQTGAKS